MNRTITSAALTILISSPVFAGGVFADGNELLRRCESKNPVDGMYCAAYIASVHDFASSASKVCKPDSASLGQLTKVVAKYMNDNPTMLHIPATYLATMALADAFPCKP